MLKVGNTVLVDLANCARAQFDEAAGDDKTVSAPGQQAEFLFGSGGSGAASLAEFGCASRSSGVHL
jgi:hypothetical protein